jgi:DNA-binding winged helix-turn-helix (wHTH) protein/TolB-like protein
MQMRTKGIYEFGRFQLNGPEGILLKEGRPVPLTPKVFDLLILLVENRGHLVQKEDIMSRLWPENFVEETNINRNISTLRRALSDSPNEPAYIETVPKRGFRFVAPVAEVEPEAEIVLERRTSAVIITEHEETIDNHLTDDTFRQATRIAHSGLTARLRRHVLALSTVVLLVFGAAVVVWLATARGGHATATARIKSIAVLPFNDIGAARDEHLGMGLADVLITRLSNLREVKVRPTSAVQEFERPQQESTVVGQLLGVDAVLEGSIYRSHGQIRVTARLLRVSDSSPIWSGQFDDKAEDVLAVQNAIAEQVVESLALNLSADEKANLSKRYSENADAYQLYVQGRYYWNKRSWPGMTQAEYFFRRAIEKDPDFGLAYLGLADKLFTESGNPEAYTALSKAIAIDPNLGEAYATQGFAQMFHQWDWQKAEESFRRVIELKPGYGTAHQWYATLLAITGRVDEAKQEMRQALEIDPMSANFLADLGQMHYFAREYAAAESYCRKAIEVAPDFAFAHEYLIDIYLKTGREPEGFEESQNWNRSNTFGAAHPKISESNDSRVRAQYLNPGMRGFLRKRIEDLGTAGTDVFYVLAKSYALLGDKEQTLAQLEKSYEVKDFLLPFVNADPIFDDVRAEPRYQAVLHRMNLSRK